MPADLNERDCWLCGADVNRCCWCHAGLTEPGDGRPCRCDVGRENDEQ